MSFPLYPPFLVPFLATQSQSFVIPVLPPTKPLDFLSGITGRLLGNRGFLSQVPGGVSIISLGGQNPQLPDLSTLPLVSIGIIPTPTRSITADGQDFVETGQLLITVYAATMSLATAVGSLVAGLLVYPGGGSGGSGGSGGTNSQIVFSTGKVISLQLAMSRTKPESNTASSLGGKTLTNPPQPKFTDSSPVAQSTQTYNYQYFGSVSTVAGSSSFNINTSYRNVTESDSGGSVIDTFQATFLANSMSGTGASQADRFFRDYQILNNNSMNYVLSALPNGQGMARVRKFYLENLSPIGSGAVLTIGPASSNGWTNGLGGNLQVIPGGVFVYVQPDLAGIPVTSGSNDTVMVSVSGSGTYRLAVEGVSV